MEIEEYTMTHVQKVEHIVSKDDAEKAGKGELDSTLFALSQWNVESSWFVNNLFLCIFNDRTLGSRCACCSTSGQLHWATHWILTAPFPHLPPPLCA